MPFVKRDEHGVVVAVSRESAAGCTEELATDDPAISEFLMEISNASSSLDASDQHFIRVLEDVVDLLIAKGLVLFTELPADAQQKIMRRQKMRSEVSSLQGLISKD
jgi:hypothetical protein